MPSDGEPELPIAKELRNIVGPKARVIWRGAELDLYARDQADIPDSLRKMLIRTTPDAVVQPESVEDVANVVAFLAGPDSDYMTGQAVNVDGGLVMGN